MAEFYRSVQPHLSWGKTGQIAHVSSPLSGIAQKRKKRQFLKSVVFHKIPQKCITWVILTQRERVVKVFF